MNNYTFNAMLYPGLDPGTENRHLWKKQWNANKVCSLAKSNAPMLISWLASLLGLCKTLLSEELGPGYMGTLCPICDFFSKLKLFQNDKFI